MDTSGNINNIISINVMCAFHGRGKNKVVDPYKLKDIYDDYIKSIDKESPYYMDLSLFKAITEDYLRMLAAEIVDNASIYKIPYRLGTFQIVKLDYTLTRDRTYPIDYKLSGLYNKPVYMLNEHSGGYRYMFKWDKKHCITKHKTFYRFIPTRSNKRKMAYNIKNKIVDYFDRN